MTAVGGFRLDEPICRRVPTDAPEQELEFARQHFFLDRRYRDPFHTDMQSTETAVEYDSYDLLVLKTLDPVGNTIHATNDYRVLQTQTGYLSKR